MHAAEAGAHSPPHSQAAAHRPLANAQANRNAGTKHTAESGCPQPATGSPAALGRPGAAQAPQLPSPPADALPNQSHLPSLTEAQTLPALVDASRRANARPSPPGQARPDMRGARATPAASPQRSAAACTPRDEPSDGGPDVPGGLRICQGPLAPAPGPLAPPALSPPAPRFRNGLRLGLGLKPGSELGFEAAAGGGRSRAISGSTSRERRATPGAHSGLMASVGGAGGVKGAKRPGGPECPYLRARSPASAANAWPELEI